MKSPWRLWVLGAASSKCPQRNSHEESCMHTAWGFTNLHEHHTHAHAWFLAESQGHLARNKVAIGLAVEKLGVRPAQDSVEQAVYQFFSLCSPKCQEICSGWAMASKNLAFMITHACIYMHGFTLCNLMHACGLRCEAQNAISFGEKAHLHVLSHCEVACCKLLMHETSRMLTHTCMHACMQWGVLTGHVILMSEHSTPMLESICQVSCKTTCHANTSCIHALMQEEMERSQMMKVLPLTPLVTQMDHLIKRAVKKRRFCPQGAPMPAYWFSITSWHVPSFQVEHASAPVSAPVKAEMLEDPHVGVKDVKANDTPVVEEPTASPAPSGLHPCPFMIACRCVHACHACKIYVRIAGSSFVTPLPVTSRILPHKDLTAVIMHTYWC